MQAANGSDAGEEAAAAAKPPQLGQAVQCLVAAWRTCSAAVAEAHESAVLDSMAYALRPGAPLQGTAAG